MALSASHEDYLRAIWKLGEWQEKPVTPGDLTRTLGLSPSTVSEGVQRLVSMGLVRHARYGNVSLTKAGRDEAARMVRIHRLIETGLMTIFGYSWDEVHDEAEHLEHAVSATFVERLDAALGHPRHDPHGDPIPRPDGSLPEAENAVSLRSLGPGEAGVVHRVDDADSAVLKELAGIGLVPGASVSVADVKRGLGLMRVSTPQTSADISLSVADAVSVTH
jgi:iron-dependent repressor ideR